MRMEDLAAKKINMGLPGVGIDLGTTNSVIAILTQKANGDLVTTPVAVPRADDSYSAGGKFKLRIIKKTTLPSCVYYPQENNYNPVVGDFAKRQYALRPQLVAKSIKSQMGNEFAEGLAEEVPDKTPSEISARILTHLISTTEKLYRTDIKDAVITVPANFDPAMRGATLEAARLAGIRTTNQDGSLRDDVLLSEPNAVICDLINQIHNGELPSTVIDLNEPQNVLVFDLGGGTLDVTLHNIRYSDGTHKTIKINEIATNRYTRLGGDDFDLRLAEVMFERYIAQNSRFGTSVIAQFKKDRKLLMPTFLAFAESMKIDLSNSQNSDIVDYSAWDDDDADEGFNTGGNPGNGYSYDDNFSKEDIEEIFESFMGREYKLSDYVKLDTIRDSRNIIYPILDVLKKASIKLETNEFKVDAVILNGGMSRFYMVIERLRKFFGLEPIVVTDPDLAVARGAAVYHYYVREHSKLVETEKKTIDNVNIISREGSEEVSDATASLKVETKNPQHTANYGMDWGKSILNDALYLGLQNGAKEKELIPTGQELPYRSELMKGFKIDAGNDKISLPIRGKRIDGSIYTIARGSIKLRKAYSKDTYVAFVVDMSPSKVMTMHADIYNSLEYTNLLESVKAEMLIGTAGEENIVKKKLAAPLGSTLNAGNEIQQLLMLCGNGQRNKHKKFNVNNLNSKKIRAVLEAIHRCDNKKDFARPVLNELVKDHFADTNMRLLTLARKLCDSWSAIERRELAEICMALISGEIAGFHSFGPKINVNLQAIYALGKVGSPAQMIKVAGITNNKYREAMMYAFACNGTNIDWIYDKFVQDVDRTEKGLQSSIQNSAYAMGTALRRDLHPDVVFAQADEAVKKLCSCLNSYNLTNAEWVPVVLALGWICDQRYDKSNVSDKTLASARTCLNNCGSYSEDIMTLIDKGKGIALKLMDGNDLDKDEELYLLKFAEEYEQ